MLSLSDIVGVRHNSLNIHDHTTINTINIVTQTNVGIIYLYK